jgi:hypothetical protein
MNSELIGIWSADARFGPGAQSDEMLVFKPDGTGWIEVWNFCLCELEFFEWTLTSLGWVAVVATKRMEIDVGTDQLVDSQASMEVKHLPYQVQEEDTPSGARMKVLRIELLGLGEEAFGFFGDEDVDSRLKRIMGT